MAKTKTPFLSMGAQGSVGRSLTAQKTRSGTLLRGKPLPTDPYSLKQAYQRWLYEDYAYLWRQQTQATRQTYTTAGSRLHLTGFQYWMKYNLTNMPDIAGIWHLDAEDHTICYDHSPRGNNGTVIGASPASGHIDGALYFDGVNDLINFGHKTTLDITAGQAFTIEGTLDCPDSATNRIILGKRGADPRYWLFRLIATGALAFIWNDGAAGGIISATVGYDDAQPHHVAITRAGTTWIFYANGLPEGTYINTMGDVSNTVPSQIGVYNFVSQDMLGTLDHIIFYKRTLDTSEILRHSLRRYPPQ